MIELSNGNNMRGDILTCHFCEEKNNNVIPLFECDDYSPIICLKCYFDYFWCKYYHFIINTHRHLSDIERNKIAYWVPDADFYFRIKDIYLCDIKTTSTDTKILEAIERFKDYHNKDVMERSSKKWSSINETTLIQKTRRM